MTAAERAADVLAKGTHSIWCPWGEEHDVEVGYAVAGEDLVAALMADPALLVDLAIEAGALEPWGHWLTAERNGVPWCNHADSKWCSNEHIKTPIYRRTTQENDQ